MPTKVGYATGECPRCGETLRRRRPADYVVCDCYQYCPICGEKMTPYTPDLTPSTYGAIESDEATGDTESPIKILYFCVNCKYYSAQLPVEVALT